MFPIIDLHCDLLSYLAQDPQRTPYDPQSRCAIPQLQKGNVISQIFAIFTKTGPEALSSAKKQIDIFDSFFGKFPQIFYKHAIPSEYDPFQPKPILARYAFENGSSFCGEDEPLSKGIDRLWNACDRLGNPVYISFTWNHENRFGGGALTRMGLKDDGIRLLEALHEKQIALDLSHASDPLAYDIINTLEKNNLHIPIMASHSNSRTVHNVPRNLPDELAQEIFKRNGVIGLNFYMGIVGESEDQLIKHVAHWLEMGGEDHISLGADFFYGVDLSSNKNQKNDFFETFADSSSYPHLLQFLQKELRLDKTLINKIAYKNAQAFFIPKHVEKAEKLQKAP